VDQVYGDGCDASLLERHPSCFFNLDNPIVGGSATVCRCDGSTMTNSYEHQLLVKFE
jgi:hypothetical protein